MDYITSKTFMIAIGIFVTLVIVTGLILVFTKISDIYNLTENTNTSILSQYDNLYSMYSGAKLNTVGLLNTLRKYQEDPEVGVKIIMNGVTMDAVDENKKSVIQIIEGYVENNDLGYEEMFNVKVEENDPIVNIVFEKI